MSKTFLENIKGEIQNREKIILEAKQKAFNEEKANAKKRMLQICSEQMQDNLLRLETFKVFFIDGDNWPEFCEKRGKDAYKLRNKVLEELGFECKMTDIDDYSEYFTLIVTIPEFEGGQRTPAQELLLKFEQDLKKAQDQKKKEILEKCRAIKERIGRGEFDYSRDAYTSEGRYVICVESELEAIAKGFELNLVVDFFSCLCLKFCKIWFDTKTGKSYIKFEVK